MAAMSSCVGYTEFPETRAALVKFLKVLGFKVDDRMESLPAAGLGKEIFGLVQAPHSICYDQPSGRQRPENDCLIGEPLYVLREENGHLLVHSGEGYLGYVRSKDVLRVDAAGFAKYLAGKRVRIKSDQKIGDLPIPAGASLKWVSSDGETVTVELPTGQQVKLPAASCEMHRDTAADIEKVVAKGKQVLGTHYLWGGKTSEGIDCSGLVQSSYLAAGVHLAARCVPAILCGPVVGHALAHGRPAPRRHALFPGRRRQNSPHGHLPGRRPLHARRDAGRANQQLQSGRQGLRRQAACRVRIRQAAGGLARPRHHFTSSGRRVRAK